MKIPKKEKRVIVSFTISPVQKERIERIVKQTNNTFSEVVRRLIDGALDGVK